MLTFENRVCVCQRFGECRCDDISKAKKIWKINIYDACQTIGEVMKFFGLVGMAVNNSRKIIESAFFHYDTDRDRVDGPYKKVLRKKDLMYKLGHKAGMGRIDSQLTYSIVKRVFRAFYYLTDQYGLPFYDFIPKAYHKSECIWVQAAITTADIYARMEGMFEPTRRLVQEKLKCKYKQLYDRIKIRIDDFDKIRIEHPRRSCKRFLTPLASEQEGEEEECICPKPICNCPPFECVCEWPSDVSYLGDYSQEPYIVRWKPMYERDECPQPEIPQSTSCTPSGGSCEECPCEVCECIPCPDALGEHELGEQEEWAEEDDPCSLKKLGPPRPMAHNIFDDGSHGLHGEAEDPCIIQVEKKVLKHHLHLYDTDEVIVHEGDTIKDEPSSSVTVEIVEVYICGCKVKKRKKAAKKKKLPCCKICVPRKPRRWAPKKPQPPPCTDDEFEFSDFKKYIT